MDDAKVLSIVGKLRRELRAAKTNDDIWQCSERIQKLAIDTKHHPEVIELRREAKEKEKQLKHNSL